jgi:bifunctional NMN adenylyltransferase/nudix hydrolase
MKEFGFCVFIGRFSPFHLAHSELLNEALNIAEHVIVVIGSSYRARDIKNPWTAAEREAMIRVSLQEADGSRVHFVHMRDYLYNDNLWITDLQQRVTEITSSVVVADRENQMALIGHEHDRSSYYLKLFPQWKFVTKNNIDKYPHATKIRDLYFTHDVEYKQYVHSKIFQYMEDFKKTEVFKNLKSDYDYIKEYKGKWEGAPFKPTFNTVDAIVIKSGHVLVVRRKGNPGKGLIALPGGFLNQEERIQVGALRELKEETGIKVSKEDLEAAIVDQRVFDHPDRSLRGRTITHAFLINLKAGPLPQVKGADDADKAWWMPLSEFFSRESDFFEDHWHIIQYFVSRF